MNKLPTTPYKGVRDFYPNEQLMRAYIFDMWSSVAETFGFQRYDASVLEPAELYTSKGAENAEMVSEQTYIFTDRGDREVTLRPEMTPTVARMVAGKRNELTFPLRWYSIPNLYRYERMQRGRLREHWQLNCDIFGTDDYTADVEIIALAYELLTAFGATPEMFEIQINSREWIQNIFEEEGLTEDVQKEMYALLDRKDKIDNFEEEMERIAGKHIDFDRVLPETSPLQKVVAGLHELGITNVAYSPSIVRGFNYYTGTVFEVFDKSEENNRSLLGGGRYNNLTELFDENPIPGVGFGMGDVTMCDFLKTHDLVPDNLSSFLPPSLMILPATQSENMDAQKLARIFRSELISCAVDMNEGKIGAKIKRAEKQGAEFILVLGEDEVKDERYTVKELSTGSETTGTTKELIEALTGNES